jgi:hypothetical protein
LKNRLCLCQRIPRPTTAYDRIAIRHDYRSALRADKHEIAKYKLNIIFGDTGYCQARVCNSVEMVWPTSWIVYFVDFRTRADIYPLSYLLTCCLTELRHHDPEKISFSGAYGAHESP